MKTKTYFAAGIFAALFGSAAHAASDEVLAQIIQDLTDQGYQRIEIKNAPDWVKVEAYGPDGSLEQFYDGLGQLRREERQASEEAGSDDAPRGAETDHSTGSDDHMDDGVEDEHDDGVQAREEERHEEEVRTRDEGDSSHSGRDHAEAEDHEDDDD